MFKTCSFSNVKIKKCKKSIETTLNCNLMTTAIKSSGMVYRIIYSIIDVSIYT